MKFSYACIILLKYAKTKKQPSCIHEIRRYFIVLLVPTIGSFVSIAFRDSHCWLFQNLRGVVFSCQEMIRQWQHSQVLTSIHFINFWTDLHLCMSNTNLSWMEMVTSFTNYIRTEGNQDLWTQLIVLGLFWHGVGQGVRWRSFSWFLQWWCLQWQNIISLLLGIWLHPKGIWSCQDSDTTSREVGRVPGSNCG
jgi:hypothetical protein